MIHTILLYFQFFTAIPINYSISQAEVKLKKGVIYLPLFAFIYGGILAFIFVLSRFLFSPSIAWILLILMDVLLTRGFHYDALADTADGLLSSKKADEMVRIMKDPAIGANGALILILISLLTYVVGKEILETSNLNEMLVVLAWAASGRCILPLLFFHLVYVGDNPRGLGSSFLGVANWRVWASQCLSMALYAFLGRQYLLAYLIILPIVLIYRHFVNQQIGGMTGDTMGAAVMIGQVIYLLILVIQL
ncbi:adenosylcobinamide-GDP ribazoletransferase [Facklamia miroungae]|uniref:Adenosylcobinamide-GDP ribazoletransferase n=1 Tax=Facklamia miroungae TaxID=120956 RepID=A0A1G7R0J5_9LACT|nr:adenosylcobinamide-GDP ribazoletransferase [Facklamia miroungae]NKZ29135.1 adenosylcobinamide-GDP ribazoletransferase [Facklamia miroungae]SDG04286.1 adenosylcobinamide-GDP ribazoletransferase [Facklamia miroungae]